MRTARLDALAARKKVTQQMSTDERTPAPVAAGTRIKYRPDLRTRKEVSRSVKQLRRQQQAVKRLALWKAAGSLLVDYPLTAEQRQHLKNL